MKAIIVEDGLASNGPHSRPLKEKDPPFILGGRPGDHELLFSWFEASEPGQTWERRDRKAGTVQRSGWDHGLPPTDANLHLKASMLRYEETDAKGGMQRFPWVTDLPLGRDTVMSVMRCGRRRWATGNGTFQTLKARDPYRFEHNFGHGHNHLADVLPTLAMPAFLTARAQRHCCTLFGRARRRQGRSPCLWNRLREPGRTFAFPDWRTPCRAIAGQPGREDHLGLIRAGRWPPRPRPNHPDPALRRNFFRPDSRPAISHAHTERPARTAPPNRPSAGQRTG